ncbi:MAG: S8 family serine peptidase, partial [Chloroflexi bacterium]|nr:S8 family serine peptidase [Chloroflexota bacterium]
CPLLLAVTLTAAQPRPAQPDVVPGQVLVGLADSAAAPAASPATLFGYPVRAIVALTGLYVLDVPVGEELRAAARLARQVGVRYAQPNYRLYDSSRRPRPRRLPRPQVPPEAAPIRTNDPLFPRQWALERLNALEAWRVTPGAPDIIIALLDTGIDETHPDRPVNLLLGPNLVAPGLPRDDNGHGTHLAGIVAAATNNGIGVAGVAPGVAVGAIKALDAHGESDDAQVAQAVDWVVRAGARIMNLSLVRSGQPSRALEDALTAGRRAGILFVAAAGNCGDGLDARCQGQVNPVQYPASLPQVLAVGAVDRFDQRAPFSAYRDYVALVAPGVDLLSTCWPGEREDLYCTKSGTSMAAAYVSGIAALVRSVNVRLTPDEVTRILLRATIDLGPRGRDPYYGAGIVNAHVAVRDAQRTLINPRHFVYLPLVRRQTEPATPQAPDEEPSAP